MRYICLILCTALLLCGCSATSPGMPPLFGRQENASQQSQSSTLPEEIVTVVNDPLQVLIDAMTIEERVGQLFLARCNKETALEDISKYHLGGFVLFAENFQGETPETILQTLTDYQAAAHIPMLLAVDEEGGTVCRISRYAAFRNSRLPSPRAAYREGGLKQALENEKEKCILLRSLGLNVNIGPVCDISNVPGSFMYSRSLGEDPVTTGEFVDMTVRIMKSYGIGSVLKHFPGYGNNADTHTGIAIDQRDLRQLEQEDLVPFSYGVKAGCGAVLMSHTVVEALDDSAPASLSAKAHEYLRKEMGYKGVILTDDLVMEAIAERYGAEEAAVLAVLAGNDLLCSTEYATQYNAVLNAVLEGRISLEQLDAAIYRVLQWKQSLGLI